MSGPELNQASVFAALGDPTRLALLAKLSTCGNQSIARLASGSEVSRQAITKHLRVLEDVRLVKSVRAGREMHFAFQPEAVAASRQYLDEVSQQWNAALNRLQAFVEE
jgi:DNA-binding transcriptional ArsR family regulator